MSPNITNNKTNRNVIRLSLAVFIMLTCLFLFSSCTEKKTIHKKNYKLNKKSFKIDLKNNSKLNKTTENPMPNVEDSAEKDLAELKENHEKSDHQIKNLKGKLGKHILKALNSSSISNLNKTMTENKDKE